MIVLENGDLIEGDATTAAECDFTIHGLDNNALKQLADGQLANSKGTIFTADSTDVVSSIILVNTGAAHNHVNLYLKPSGGTSRRLIAKDLQLEPGYSLHFDGAKMMVMDVTGGIVSGSNVSDVAFAASWDGITTEAPSKNAVYDASLQKLLSATGDVVYASAANTLAKLAKGTEGQALLMGASDIPEWGTVASGLPLGYLSGLGISHAADTEHDITVAVGEARDGTDADDMVLASAITKQFDAAWSVGSAAGGFAAGESLPASGTIHIWLIKRADTGVVDVMANDHATSGLTPTLPAGYDYKRRIFSLRTNSSNNIINGNQWGAGLIREWRYDSPTLDVSNATPGTNAVTAALNVPGGIKVKALINVSNSSAMIYISSLDNTDMAPSQTAAPLGSSQNWISNPGPIGQLQPITNTSSQIRYRNSANSAVYIATIGWEDSL